MGGVEPLKAGMAYRPHPSQDQGNPQTSIDAETYRAYVSAAITGILTADPKAPAIYVAQRAHGIAEVSVQEQNRRNQINDYGYTNLY